MKYQVDRVIRFRGLGDSVIRSIQFRLKSPEHTIPDNEGRAVVLIQVMIVFSMVHSVMGRRRKNKLYGTRQFVYHLGVYPELVEYRNLMTDKENYRMKACHGYGQKKEYLKALYP